jgi:hypothetical protein
VWVERSTARSGLQRQVALSETETFDPCSRDDDHDGQEDARDGEDEEAH